MSILVYSEWDSGVEKINATKEQKPDHLWLTADDYSSCAFAMGFDRERVTKTLEYFSKYRQVAASLMHLDIESSTFLNSFLSCLLFERELVVPSEDVVNKIRNWIASIPGIWAVNEDFLIAIAMENQKSYHTLRVLLLFVNFWRLHPKYIWRLIGEDEYSNNSEKGIVPLTLASSDFIALSNIYLAKSDNLNFRSTTWFNTSDGNRLTYHFKWRYSSQKNKDVGKAFPHYRHFCKIDSIGALRALEEYILVWWFWLQESGDIPIDILRAFIRKHILHIDTIIAFLNKKWIDFYSLNQLTRKVIEAERGKIAWGSPTPKKTNPWKLWKHTSILQPSRPIYTSNANNSNTVDPNTRNTVPESHKYEVPIFIWNAKKSLISWQWFNWTRENLVREIPYSKLTLLWIREDWGEWISHAGWISINLNKKDIGSYEFCYTRPENTPETENSPVERIQIEQKKNVWSITDTVPKQVAVNIPDQPKQEEENPLDAIALNLLSKIGEGAYAINEDGLGNISLRFSDCDYVARWYKELSIATLSGWGTENDHAYLIDLLRKEITNAFTQHMALKREREEAEKTRILIQVMGKFTDMIIALSWPHDVLNIETLLRASRHNDYHAGIIATRNGYKEKTDKFLVEMRKLWVIIEYARVDISWKKDEKWKEFSLKVYAQSDQENIVSIHSTQDNYTLQGGMGDEKLAEIAKAGFALFGLLGRRIIEEPHSSQVKKWETKPTVSDVLGGNYKKPRTIFTQLEKGEQDTIRDLIKRLDEWRGKISKGAYVNYEIGFLDHQISSRKGWQDIQDWDMLVLRDESIRAESSEHTKPNPEVYDLLEVSEHFQKYMLLRWVSTITDIEGISLPQYKRQKSPFQNWALEFFRAFWFSLSEEKRNEFKNNIGLDPNTEKLSPTTWLRTMYDEWRTLFHHFMYLIRRGRENAITYQEGSERKIYQQRWPIPLIYTRPSLITQEDLREYRQEIAQNTWNH